MTLTTVRSFGKQGNSPPDVPRPILTERGPGDKAFRITAYGIGSFMLALTVSIGLFLGYQAIPTLHRYGFKFFTETQFNPELNKVGILAVLIGTIEVAIIAIVVAFPLSLGLALYVSQYAPPRLKGILVGAIDLLAAVPSIIFGVWGADEFQKHALFFSHWLHQYLGFIPIFKVDTDPNAPVWAQTRYTASAFIAGVVVALMVIPIAATVMRGVFDQAPSGEREAAYALGATKWGMIRSVVLPYGRGGIIGGMMLGLGRALGETVAVLLIISGAFDIKIRILEAGTQTISTLIASRFAEASAGQLSALLTAGFVLFLMTLLVNTLAGVVISRSRSGAGGDI